eukprot:g3771.t1
MPSFFYNHDFTKVHTTYVDDIIEMPADELSAPLPMGTANSPNEFAKIREAVDKIALDIGRAAVMDDKRLTQYIIAKAKQSSASLNSSRPTESKEFMKHVMRAVIQRIFPEFAPENGLGVDENLIREVIHKFPAFNSEMCENWKLDIDEEKLKYDLFKPGGVRDQFVQSNKADGPKWSMSLACGVESDSELEGTTLDFKMDKVLQKLNKVRSAVEKQGSMFNKKLIEVLEYLEKNMNPEEEEEYSPVNAPSGPSASHRDEATSSCGQQLPWQRREQQFWGGAGPAPQQQDNTKREVGGYCDAEYNRAEDDPPSSPFTYKRIVMGEEDLHLGEELDSDVELDEAFDDEFVPGDQQDLQQEDEQQQQSGLVIGGHELHFSDDEDDDVDPANMRWIDEEERAPSPEELWQKISSHVGVSGDEQQQPTNTAPAGTLQTGAGQQQAASGSSSKAHQPAIGAATSSSSRAPGGNQASSSPAAMAGQQPTRVNTYTHLINTTEKKTLMLPKECVLIVDETDVDWFTKLLDTSRMRLPEVEKELREADSQFYLHTIELERPLYEVCSQSFHNMHKNNIRAEPTSTADRWWAQRSACYLGSVLQTSMRYATHDGESVCSSEDPQLYDFIRTLDPVSLQYAGVFRDTLYLFHNSNKEKKKLPRFVSCMLSTVRVIASLQLLQLSFFCLRLHTILQAPSLTINDRKAVLQCARLDPVSSLLSRAFKIVVPRGGELSREALFKKAAHKYWPFQSRDDQLRNYCLAVSMKMKKFNPYGAKPTAAGSLTDVVTESTSGATSSAVDHKATSNKAASPTTKDGNAPSSVPKISSLAAAGRQPPPGAPAPLTSTQQKKLDKAKAASERKAAAAAKKAASAAAKATAAAQKKAASAELKSAKAKQSQRQSTANMRQSAMAALSASGKGGELGKQGTGTIQAGKQHTLHNILSGSSVQPPPAQKGKGMQTITKSIGKGDPVVAPKAGSGTAANISEEKGQDLSPLSEFNEASLNQLSSSSVAKAASSGATGGLEAVADEGGAAAVAAKAAAATLSGAAERPAAVAEDGGAEVAAAKAAATATQVINILNGSQQQQQDVQMLSPRNDNFGPQLPEAGMQEAQPPAQQLGQIPSVPTTGTGTHNDPIVLSQDQSQGLFAHPHGNAEGYVTLEGGEDGPADGIFPKASEVFSCAQPSNTSVVEAEAQPPGQQQQNASAGEEGILDDAQLDALPVGPPRVYFPGSSATAAPPTAPAVSSSANSNSTNNTTPATGQQGPTLQQPDPAIITQQKELRRLTKALEEQRKRTEAERARNTQIQKEMEEKRAADQAAHAAKMKQIEAQMQSNTTSLQQMMEQQRKASEDQMEAARRAADQQMEAARKLADQQLTQQRTEAEIYAQAQRKEVEAQALAARQTAERQAKEALDKQSQLQAAHQKMQDERDEVFKQKIKKDQDKMAQQRQELQQRHQDELQRREQETQKAKEALVTRQQADAVRAQLGGHNPGLAATNPLQPLLGMAPGGGMDGMFASGPDGLDVVEAEHHPRSMQQSLDEIVAEGKAKLDALRETLDMQTQEKDLFQKYRTQQEELRKVQQQVAEGQPDGGKHLVENAFAAAALYSSRKLGEEEAAPDPMFNIKTVRRPDGIKKEDRKVNCDNAAQYMELPRSGAHCGGFKPNTESIPAAVMRHVTTVGVNPNSDKRWISPQVSRQVIHEITTYVQAMAEEKVTTGTCTPREFFSDQFWGIHLRSTIDACLLQFDKDAGDPNSTCFVDFREDLMILVANDKTSKVSFSAAIEVAAEKGKAPALDMSQMSVPLGFTSKDRLSRTWEKIVYVAVSNDSGLRRVLQRKDRKELSCLRSVLAKLRDDVEVVIGTEDPDPARIVKDNAEKLWKEFNMRSCVLGLTYTCGRIARMSELQTKNFYDSLDLKLKEGESALVKEMLKKSRTLWLLTLALEYMRENPHGVNAPPTTTVDLVRKWTTWLLAIPIAPKEQETYVMQERAKSAKEKAAADKLRQEQKQFLAKKGKGENMQPLNKNKNQQYPGKGNYQHQPNAGAPSASNKRPGANDNSGGPPPKQLRTGDATSDRAEKQKAFVEAMRIQFCKKFDVEFDVMKEQTKRNCCI